ncbi:MAG: DUF92 domain-containing protein [Candidatus Micrarchaeia archaeon]
MRFFTLDAPGVISAIALGLAVLILGGAAGPYFLFALLLFLVLSAAVTELGRVKKQGIGQYEKSRGWRNVAANGTPALAIAAIYFANLSIHFAPYSLLIVAYASSIAAITADKFAHEIGIMDGTPITLLTMKKAAKGTSGAVTALGTLAGLGGALIIGASVLLVYSSLAYALIIMLAGFLGNVVDTLLGYFEEHGFGNTHTSNLGCAIAGALFGLFLVLAV